MSRVARFVRGVVAAAASLCLSVACTPTDPPSSPSPAGTPTGASAPSSPAVPASTPGTGSASPTPSTTLTSGRATPHGIPLSFEIYRLTNRENLLVLEFGYRNVGDTENSLRDLLAKNEGTFDLGGVYLRDPDTQLNYWPATSAGACVCTDGLDERVAQPGQVLALSVTFGAPEGDVDELDVHLASVRTFEDIPIS